MTKQKKNLLFYLNNKLEKWDLYDNSATEKIQLSQNTLFPSIPDNQNLIVYLHMLFRMSRFMYTLTEWLKVQYL